MQFKRSRDRVTAGNGGSDHDDDTPEPDRLRALAEATITRVEQLEKPTARDLSAAQQAQRVLDDADRRGARKNRPATPLSSKPSPLLELLARRADEAEQDPGRADLEARRYALSPRWVRATLRQRRAEHPDWDTHKVHNTNPKCGRPPRFEREWKLLCGHDPAGARDHVPPRASPEKIRQLTEQLDREEAELEALEARYAA